MTAWRLLPVPAAGFANVRCVLVDCRTVEHRGELQWLSRQERRACAQLAAEARRADWLAGRLAAKLAVRRALGSAVELAEVSVAYAPGGRPLAVYRAHVLRDLWLTISHSRGVGLAGVSCDGSPIGVDLEHSTAWFQGLAYYAMGAAERARLAANASPAADLMSWTLKEAALKALGSGLRIHPRRVEIEASYAADAGQAAWRVFTPAGGTESGRGWFCREGEWTWSVASLAAPAALGCNDSQRAGLLGEGRCVSRSEECEARHEQLRVGQPSVLRSRPELAGTVPPRDADAGMRKGHYYVPDPARYARMQAAAE
jgi:phosphopantetheinyl transferase